MGRTNLKYTLVLSINGCLVLSINSRRSGWVGNAERRMRKEPFSSRYPSVSFPFYKWVHSSDTILISIGEDVLFAERRREKRKVLMCTQSGVSTLNLYLTKHDNILGDMEKLGIA